MAVSQVKVQIQGTWHVLTYNGSTGKYEKTIKAPAVTSFLQAGGYYQLVIEATDDHGNKTTDSTNAGARLIVKETTKPVINITSQTNGAYVSNNKQPISFTLRDEAGGSGIDLSTLSLKIDSGASQGSASAGMVCTAVTNGYDCVFTPQTALADGSHAVTVNVADNDGNTATQKSASYIIDTVPPTLNVSAPVDSLKTNIASLAVTGTTNDATSSPVTVKIKLNNVDQGAVTVAGNGSFTKAITLASGSNTIAIRVTDASGQYTEVSRSVSLNTVAPSISNVAITPNPVNVSESITISCTVTDA